MVAMLEVEVVDEMTVDVVVEVGEAVVLVTSEVEDVELCVVVEDVVWMAVVDVVITCDELAVLVLEVVG